MSNLANIGWVLVSNKCTLCSPKRRKEKKNWIIVHYTLIAEMVIGLCFCVYTKQLFYFSVPFLFCCFFLHPYINNLFVFCSKINSITSLAFTSIIAELNFTSSLNLKPQDLNLWIFSSLIWYLTFLFLFSMGLHFRLVLQHAFIFMCLFCVSVERRSHSLPHE